jgi:hypothetical protein
LFENKAAPAAGRFERNISTFPLVPSWAGTPFVGTHSSSKKNACYYFLYELVFETKSGEAWVANRMALTSSCNGGTLDKSSLSRLGVLFSQDILLSRDEENVCFSAEFLAPRSDGSMEEIVVILKNRTQVEPTFLQGERLTRLLELDRFFQSWKDYGLYKNTSKAVRTQGDRDESDFDGRTYLFAPLLRCKGSKPTGDTRSTAIAVDWDVIDDAMLG